MPIFIASIALQVACIVHVMRTGRNQMWIMIIVFASIIGCIAYFIVEVMPSFGLNRQIRQAKAQVGAALDPERDLRDARKRLDPADTPANRIDTADALVMLGRHKEAVPLYRQALAKIGASDGRTGEKLALAMFESGDATNAITQLDTLPSTRSIADQDRRALIRAKSMELLGRDDDAATIYAEIVTRVTGEEVRCRYAALLLRQGKRESARVTLEEVELRMKSMSRGQRSAEAPMYSWAMTELAKLRA